MERDRWTKTLIILLVAIASLYLAEQVWKFLLSISDIILLFALAWLIAFILQPSVKLLSEHPVPVRVVEFVRRRGHERLASFLDRFHLPHGVAVSVVYFGLLVFLVVMGIFLVPLSIQQLTQLGASLPHYIEQSPDLLNRLQAEFDHYNVGINLRSIYEPQELTRRAEAIGASLIQNALVVVTSIASTVINVLLMLAISFYIMLEGQRLSRQFLQIIPNRYEEEMRFAAQSIDRTFGGFLRGQLLMCVFFGAGTTIVMWFAGLSFAMVIGFLAGLIIFVPIVGAPVAISLPILIALLQNPQATLWILVVLAVYETILRNLLMPRILSREVGMPALLVIAALVISVRLIGGWGFLFGIPIAGVVYAMSIFFMERYRERRKDEEPGEALPVAVPAVVDREARLQLMPGGEPFFFGGGSTGCLLIHGFTGTPNEMRGLGEYLAARGLTALGVRLAGHGTTVEDMEKTTWPDWYASAEEGLTELQKQCDEVFLVGLSLGGGLALHIAAHRPLAGVVAMSTPITVADWRLKYVGVLKHLVRFSRKKANNGLRDPTARARHVGYNRIPTRCAESLRDFLRLLDDELPRVTVPTLLLHARHDTQVPPENMPYIYSRISSADKKMVWLENSDHVITEDYDKEQAFAHTYAFIRQHSRHADG